MDLRETESGLLHFECAAKNLLKKGEL